MLQRGRFVLTAASNEPIGPASQTAPGVFYGTASKGGNNGTGVVFRYSLYSPSHLKVLHDFSAVDSAGQNQDGAYPYARLTRGEGGYLYSTASYGGVNANGVVYRNGLNGRFSGLPTVTATEPTTGANADGAIPDYGVLVHGDKLIGITPLGGQGSTGGFFLTGGTLYELNLDDDDRDR